MSSALGHKCAYTFSVMLGEECPQRLLHRHDVAPIGDQTRGDNAAAKYDEYGRAARRAGDEAVDGAARARAEYDGVGRKISELPSSHTVRFGIDTSEWDAAVARMRAQISEINRLSGDAQRDAIADLRSIANEAIAQQQLTFQGSRGSRG